MTARLDQTSPSGDRGTRGSHPSTASRGRELDDGDDDELDVPEFIPPE
jgi:hypothetical protein